MIRDYVELAKPRITWLILMSTAAGYYFGHAGSWRLWHLFHTLCGTGLMASGTAVLNQWYERETDARMKRTRNRPLPTGRLSPMQAYAFGVILSGLGLLELAGFVNALSALVCLATWALYLFAYTPLKTKTWWSTTVGAIPGAAPPVIGFAAAAGVITGPAIVMAAILFLWQFPHFYAIAWMYREDYAQAGIKMLPVVEPDGRSTALQMLVYATVLLPVSVMPKLLGMAGYAYAVGAVALGAWYVTACLRAARGRQRPHARRVLLTSVAYLPALYALMICDPAWF